MGEIIEARCSCGFQPGAIFAGGGFSNFETVCAAPAICLHCTEFLVENYKAEFSRCPKCHRNVTFYNDPKVQATDEEPANDQPVFEWFAGDDKGAFLLPDTRYLCPKCGNITLRFYDVGSWD
jgi:Zn finger protein HypA/HybF involved in hydrogenase expression